MEKVIVGALIAAIGIAFIEANPSIDVFDMLLNFTGMILFVAGYEKIRGWLLDE